MTLSETLKAMHCIHAVNYLCAWLKLFSHGIVRVLYHLRFNCLDGWQQKADSHVHWMSIIGQAQSVPFRNKPFASTPHLLQWSSSKSVDSTW